MRDLTNLSWAEEPFGAAHRPGVRRGEIGVGIHIAWSKSSTYLGFDAAYLRFPRRQTLRATGMLDFGFQSVRMKSSVDEAAAFQALSSLLVASRRGSILLAGANLEADLLQLCKLTPFSYRGISALAIDWAARAAQTPTLATMVDTAIDVAVAPSEGRTHLSNAPPVGSSDPGVIAGVSEALCRVIRAAETVGRITVLEDFDLAETVAAAMWDSVSS